MTSTTLLQAFQDLTTARTGVVFEDYEALHRWSIANPQDFWKLVWDMDDIQSPTPYHAVLAEDRMPGAVWFPGATVNYAAHVLRHVAAAAAARQPAIIAEDEQGPVEIVDWPTLRRRVAAFALGLRSLGVTRGDRVAAYLPNRPEAIVAFLACAAIGAVWTICAPDMGVAAILDRFQQIAPKVLIATDAVTYAGRCLDRTAIVRDLHGALPSVEALILVRSGLVPDSIGEALDFANMTVRSDADVVAFTPEWVPFDHPLWVLYSSGTTGKPKALVHGHGGILLASACARLHSDLRPSYADPNAGERFHWYSSTGWMMWNTQVGGLLSGTTICIFDGSPTGSRDAPDWGVLWRFVARNRVSFFGSGAQFYTMCLKNGLDIPASGDFAALRTLGSTASPLPAGVQIAISDQFARTGKANLWWFNSSGGTDICGAFCSGHRDLPAVPGKLQCRQLGVAIEAWNELGEPVVDEVGELVCTQPLPNMPLFLWGDESGARYRDAYFDVYPGIWRHGDWLRIEADGSCEIFGRSDATINRGGHRMGTSEIYDAIETLDEVTDSLVIDVRVNDGDSKLLLFVVPGSGGGFDAAVTSIRNAIRTALSPRFLPDLIIAVTAIPRTLSSKKQELPIKRLFEGSAVGTIIDPSAMANPECLPGYVELAAAFRARP